MSFLSIFYDVDIVHRISWALIELEDFKPYWKYSLIDYRTVGFPGYIDLTLKPKAFSHVTEKKNTIIIVTNFSTKVKSACIVVK